MHSGGLGEGDAPQGQPRCPWFSVVVPVWNRSDCVRRALDSVFAQDFQDYEVIAVDDASDDDSVAVMQSCRDPRLRIIRHPENRGVCASRGTGTLAAKGEWIGYLDSDWVLEAGALGHLASMTERAPNDVGIIGGLVRFDSGAMTSAVLPPEGPFGFVEYLHWIDTGGAGDYLACFHRRMFQQYAWPTDRRLESGFMLQVSVEGRRWIDRTVLAVEFTQSANRLTVDIAPGWRERRLAMAPALAQDAEDMIARFGADLRTHSPHWYQDLLESAALRHFLSGHRWKGLRFACRAWCRRPGRVHLIGVSIVGLLGPRFLVACRQVRWVHAIFLQLIRRRDHRGDGRT